MSAASSVPSHAGPEAEVRGDAARSATDARRTSTKSETARIARSWLVPEVLQASLMDCGPAALKAVLQGFGIRVGYDTLRERCQTDVDGTSIDALAALGRELGLTTHRVLVARDSFLLPEADCLPAIVVTRSGAGTLHFIVVWRVLGPWVQIMDPASGRRWVPKHAFLERMPDVLLPIGVQSFRAWAGSEAGLAPLVAKMSGLGIGRAVSERAITQACGDAGWKGLATLDASVRMVAALVSARAIRSGREAEGLLESLTERAGASPEAAKGGLALDVVPRRFWWVAGSDGAASGSKLKLHGAVIVHFERRGSSRSASSRSGARPDAARRDGRHVPESGACVDVATARESEPAQRDEDASPLHHLLSVVRLDQPRAIALLVLALAVSSVVTTADALLFRGVLEASRQLALGYQRAMGAFALLTFAAVGLALDAYVASLVHRVGRGIELRLRVRLLEKLPRLADRYLRSRPTSDMASRGHAMQILRETPSLASRALRALFGLVTTVIGIVWLDPPGWAWAVGAAAASIGVSYLLRRPLAESSMRMRTHASSLDRFYLDALLGVTPIRAHGAERAVRREHESLLVEWASAARAMHAQSAGVQAAQLFVSTGLVVALVASYIARGGTAAALLLLVFWTLRIPALGQELTLALVAMRDVRNVAIRLFPPLDAPETDAAHARAEPTTTRGVALRFRDVTVRAGGHRILESLSVDVPAGAHVGVVGASGAGKSSFIGLLLGWLEATDGDVEVDGRVLDPARTAALRSEIAWVDPAVHLFNRTLFDNVTFGSDGASSLEAALVGLPNAMNEADLTEVLESLSGGMQGNLGEGGVRLSGGQGQRVRLARALVRSPSKSRLVLLDEPFRGLERERRRELLRRARRHWQGATMLFVSHDVSDTVDLDRVLVIDDGRIVEDGDPRELLKSSSRYRALVEADASLRTEAWAESRFRRARMAAGRLVVDRASDGGVG